MTAETLCPRCGSEWGGDPTCGHCTDDDGNARPMRGEELDT